MKKVLIIGAGFLQSFVIQKAKSIGYETLAVDGNPEAPGFVYADKHATINIVDQEECLKYARQEKIDGVLTAATDYGVLTAAYIAKEMGLRGLNYEVAKLIKNKYLVRRRLFEAKVDDTEQAYEIDEKTDIASVVSKITFPVMVKPCDGSGSRGATRVDSALEFADACSNAISCSLSKRAEVETFVIGREYGAETLVIDGIPHVLAIMQKRMTDPPYYAELGHALPSGLRPEIETRAIKCVETAIKALGINTGSVNMDMIITPEGKIHIIDVGARMGGNLIGSHIIPYGTGIDYMECMIRNAVGDYCVPLISAQRSAVATRLLAFSNGNVTRLPDFEAISAKNSVEIYHHMAVGQEIKEYHTNADGCGYIVARGNSIPEAEENAEFALSVIKSIIFS